MPSIFSIKDQYVQPNVKYMSTQHHNIYHHSLSPDPETPTTTIDPITTATITTHITTQAGKLKNLVRSAKPLTHLNNYYDVNINVNKPNVTAAIHQA